MEDGKSEVRNQTNTCFSHRVKSSGPAYSAITTLSPERDRHGRPGFESAICCRLCWAHRTPDTAIHARCPLVHPALRPRASERADYGEALRAVGEGAAGAAGSGCPADLAEGETATRGTRRVHGSTHTNNSFQIKAKEWWRRGESNPRPKSATPRSLHAYLSSVCFALRA